MTISTAVSKSYLKATSQSGTYQVIKNCILILPGSENIVSIYSSFVNGTPTNNIGKVVCNQVPLRISTYVTLTNLNASFILPYKSDSNCILLDYTNISSTKISDYYTVLRDDPSLNVSHCRIQAKKNIFISTPITTNSSLGSNKIHIKTINNTSVYKDNIRSSFITLREGSIAYLHTEPTHEHIKTFLDDSAIPNFNYTNAYSLVKAKDLGIVSYTAGTKSSASNGLYVQKYSIKANRNIYLTTSETSISVNNISYTISACIPESLYNIYGQTQNSDYFNQIYLSQGNTYTVCYLVQNYDAIYNAIPNNTIVFVV